MNKILGIIGAGHLGQQIAYHAKTDHHFDEVVFFDDFVTKDFVTGHKVIGKISEVLSSFKSQLITHLIIGIGYKHMGVRASLYNSFKNKIPFASIVHSTSWVDPSVKIGEGVIIYPGTIIDTGCILNDNIVINVGCTIAHDTEIGAHCFISPSVALAGFIYVGEQSILGINCTVIDNIKIVSNTQIGGGGVVIDSITNSGVYVGNPVRLIRSL